MYNELSPETVTALHSLAQAAGGVGPIHITRTRICDHCKDGSKEAHPYGVHDATGKYWEHLCNQCFDALGCSYPQHDEMTCGICGASLEWKDCWNGCDDGYLNLYDEDPLFYDEDDQEVCHVCDGDGGWWVCPVAHDRQKPDVGAS